tara:strand:- start:96 stop:551 length:456 start_codon:yes stop_codon:yes gene_type:complete
MKRLFILTILFLTIQYSFGQSCGIYRINYVGSIKSEALKIEKIKVPTIMFLHGLENENSELGFSEIDLTTNDIDIQLRSNLTSNLYENAEDLLKLYKTKRENIPIIIVASKNGNKKEIRKELTWNDIQIHKISDEEFGNLFELNLNQISIE